MSQMYWQTPSDCVGCPLGRTMGNSGEMFASNVEKNRGFEKNQKPGVSHQYSFDSAAVSSYEQLDWVEGFLGSRK